MTDSALLLNLITYVEHVAFGAGLAAVLAFALMAYGRMRSIS